MKKLAISFTRYLVFYLLGFIVYFLISYITSAFYALLCEWFPSVFSQYTPINDEREYEILCGILNVTTALLSLYTVTYLAVVYDNERYEYMIEKTDGFYTLRNGFSLYFSRYSLTDSIVATAVPLLVLGLSFITAPSNAPRFILIAVDLIDELLSVSMAFTDALGFIWGAVLLALFSVAFRLPSAYFAVKRFRGAWLSNTEG